MKRKRKRRQSTADAQVETLEKKKFQLNNLTEAREEAGGGGATEK